MRVLIIGQGGREHALAWKAALSPQVVTVYVAPGNAGTALEPGVINVPLAATDIAGLLQFAQAEAIDLTIVGPEAPLALGIVDQFQAHGLACFGPTQAAAQLESSKIFCKQFLMEHRIPTADYQVFDDALLAKAYVATQTFPVVIKADGLAAGKGVVVAEDLAQAQAAIDAMLVDQRFGTASQRIVIEEFLTGYELSFIVMTDGIFVLPLASSQDHKRRDDHDQGPNTGGMGAYSPAPQLDDALQAKIMTRIIYPTVAAMAARGTPYRGFLYAGLMITPSGDPKVIEFNCRLGDPEAEPLLMRLTSDLITLCQATLAGDLANATITWDSRPALGVVMAAGGYPDDYARGAVIEGLDQSLPTTVKVFHASTEWINDQVLTNGGRVLVVTALGIDLPAAQQTAYQAVNQIHWPDCFHRTDIGAQALRFLASL